MDVKRDWQMIQRKGKELPLTLLRATRREVKARKAKTKAPHARITYGHHILSEYTKGPYTCQKTVDDFWDMCPHAYPIA